MALWNLGSNAGENVKAFTLIAADNDQFTDATTIDSFPADPNTAAGSVVAPQVFTFNSISARYFRMEITANNGATNTGMGEVAFGTPEPASWAMVASALIVGFGFHRRKRMRAAERSDPQKETSPLAIDLSRMASAGAVYDLFPHSGIRPVL